MSIYNVLMLIINIVLTALVIHKSHKCELLESKVYFGGLKLESEEIFISELKEVNALLKEEIERLRRLQT